MQAVLRGLRQRGVEPRSCSALECFAFTGAMHTLDYARRVKDLELWEVNPAHHDVLHQRFPGAQVRTVDTYEELQRRDRRFDLIVVDNSPFHGGHVEHFDMFPGLFRLMADAGVLVLDVIPELNATVLENYPEMFREEVLQTRRVFYNVTDPRKISERSMLVAYERLAGRAGFRVDWCFFRKRNPILTYCVMKMSRMLVRVDQGVNEPVVQSGRMPI